jgi:predicted DNA-binding WGR domain protein
MITLYRTDDAQNMHRFYHLRIEQTLFGEWALIREWGRIGSRKGQSLEEWFDDAVPAEAALQKLEAAKRRKGYSSSGNCSSRSATISAGRYSRASV